MGRTTRTPVTEHQENVLNAVKTLCEMTRRVSGTQG